MCRSTLDYETPNSDARGLSPVGVARIGTLLIVLFHPIAGRAVGCLMNGWSLASELQSVRFFEWLFAVVPAALLILIAAAFSSARAIWLTTLLGVAYPVFVQLTVDREADPFESLALFLAPILNLPLIAIAWALGAWVNHLCYPRDRLPLPSPLDRA